MLNESLSEDASSLISEYEVTFCDLLDTPNLDEVRKELEGKKTESLSSIVASHPASMKDTILGQATKMLDKYEKIAQKIEALLKLDSKTDDGKSYVPGSLRNKNAIEVPSYLKGNERLESIAKEGHELNEEHKQQNAKLVRDMTQAVKEEVMVEIRYDIFDTIEALSYMLLSSWKASSEFTLDLKLNEDELASLVARLFLCSEDTKATRRIWGFEQEME